MKAIKICIVILALFCWFVFVFAYCIDDLLDSTHFYSASLAEATGSD